MKYIIFFAVAILLFYLKDKYFKQLDKEKGEYYKRDGYAKFIRSSFPKLIEEITDLTHWNIFKERDDAVLIGDKQIEYLWVSQDMGRLRIAYIKQGTLIKEWRFNQHTNNQIIIEELTKFI